MQIWVCSLGPLSKCGPTIWAGPLSNISGVDGIKYHAQKINPNYDWSLVEQEAIDVGRGLVESWAGLTARGTVCVQSADEPSSKEWSRRAKDTTQCDRSFLVSVFSATTQCQRNKTHR